LARTVIPYEQEVLHGKSNVIGFAASD